MYVSREFSALVIFLLQVFATRCEKIIEPTLKPFEPFSAGLDAVYFQKQIEKYYNPCKIPNRDELVKIWFHRTYNQRCQIKTSYDANAPEGIEVGIEDMADGDMSDLYKASLISPEETLAETVYHVITGDLKEVGAIEEALCANDKEMKDLMNQKYKSRHGDGIETHLATFRSDDKEYQHVMQQYCLKGLCQDKNMKPEDADKEAQALKAIDPGKNKQEFKNKLIELLDKNCEPDMKMILEKYRQDDNGIENAIDKAFDIERVRRAYNRLTRYIEDTCKFYADELQEAVDGCGTKSDKINRIILTRCERDLGCILNKYKDMHGKTFTNRLKGDTTDRRYLTSIRYLCGKP